MMNDNWPLARNENERLIERWVLTMDDEQRELVVSAMRETDPERRQELEIAFVRTLTDEQGAILELITQHNVN